MIQGSCLCGKVNYQILGDIGDIVHCHCITCRKAHGSAFSSVAAVSESDFSLRGKEFLRSFESSKGKLRYFCGECGSQIYAKRVNTQHVILRLGTLDTDPEAIERSHIWVSQKAPWYEINGDLPEYSEYEPNT